MQALFLAGVGAFRYGERARDAGNGGAAHLILMFGGGVNVPNENLTEKKQSNSSKSNKTKPNQYTTKNSDRHTP